MIESFAAGLMLTGLLLFVGHWFPWPVKLHRLAAYVYGLAAILAGQAVWLLPIREMTGTGVDVVASLVAFAAIGGAATALGYGIDWVLNLWARSKAHERP